MLNNNGPTTNFMFERVFNYTQSNEQIYKVEV